jgi:hypothetical protein
VLEVFTPPTLIVTPDEQNTLSDDPVAALLITKSSPNRAPLSPPIEGSATAKPPVVVLLTRY